MLAWAMPMNKGNATTNNKSNKETKNKVAKVKNKLCKCSMFLRANSVLCIQYVNEIDNIMI